MTTPDLATLPAVGWRDEVPSQVCYLAPAPAGIHLGTDRAGQPVAVPAPGPAGLRVGVLGESLFGRLFALRLLATGARVTAVSRTPEQWDGLRQAAGDRLVLAGATTGWPAEQPAPPTVGGGPQALVCDLRRPPAAALADGDWRTVLHVTRAAPPRSAFWAAPDAVLALDARFAEPVARLLGEEAARVTAELVPGEIVLFQAGGAHLLRPDISPAETALLTPGRPNR
jgi:NAD(P)-dependent dehydrogenase (short-subunit alcohol dehydrogenase family)